MELAIVELGNITIALREDNENYYIVEISDDLGCVVRARYAKRDYWPELHVKSAYQIFEDLVIFTCIYIEQSEEFDRTATDVEQQNAAWWHKYGERLNFELTMD